MNISRHSVFALLTTVLLASACDSEGPPDIGEFRDVVFWDSILCIGAGQTRCYAHRPEAADLWSPVMSDCDLDERIEVAGWIETDDGYTVACDFGGLPQTFPEFRCFVVEGAVSCYGGDDGWYTRVGPSCDIGDYSSSTWMATSCDADKQIGVHEYDHVFVSPTTKTGRVFDGPDHFGVVPTCKLAGLGAPAGPGGC